MKPLDLESKNQFLHHPPERKHHQGRSTNSNQNEREAKDENQSSKKNQSQKNNQGAADNDDGPELKKKRTNQKKGMSV